ncbi:hypothetical protein EAS64_33745 [Trebonia kvetii]|uniref:Uncharacterized protein n=1 Tax=Trebonia kvetii TaxID=2480626 RepID=A0A6P2BSW8_9ACTN|nr:hypothetical protein [Trebonia kvetii]TVZ01245.1 hypothetical protein EAS64_33745 [Trebonia kvetii]
MTLTEVLANCKTNAPKGFALLNEKGPEGWLAKVDLDDFTIGRASRCVLGYAYGSYHFGMKELFNLTEEMTATWDDHAEGHGFDATGGPQRFDRIAELDADWRAIITAAREEAAS